MPSQVPDIGIGWEMPTLPTDATEGLLQLRGTDG
jgi:hypothetical protein